MILSDDATARFPYSSDKGWRVKGVVVMSERIWTRIAAAGGIFYVVITVLGNAVLGSGG